MTALLAHLRAMAIKVAMMEAAKMKPRAELAEDEDED